MPDTGPLTCWLCKRPLGAKIEYHHPVPKSRGGRIIEPVHPICHRTLHRTLTNKQLKAIGADLAKLRAGPEIAHFLTWISNKPPDFHAPTHRRR